MNKTKKHEMLPKIVLHAFLIFCVIVTMVPFIYIVLISFGLDMMNVSGLGGNSFTLNIYSQLFSETKYLNWLCNSLLVSFGTMIVALVIVSVSSYMFSRFKFAGKNFLFNTILLIQIFPLTLMMVSLFKIFVAFDLLNKLIGLIIVDSVISSAGLVLLAKGYFDTIPYDIDEAGMIDGANRIQILWHITLPLVKPILGIIAIQSFVMTYNEYAIASLLMTTGLTNMTVSVGLQSLIYGQLQQNWGLYCAGSSLASVPILILFYSLQNYFIGGLTDGSVKL